MYLFKGCFKRCSCIDFNLQKQTYPKYQKHMFNLTTGLTAITLVFQDSIPK